MTFVFEYTCLRCNHNEQRTQQHVIPAKLEPAMRSEMKHDDEIHKCADGGSGRLMFVGASEKLG